MGSPNPPPHCFPKCELDLSWDELAMHRKQEFACLKGEHQSECCNLHSDPRVKVKAEELSLAIPCRSGMLKGNRHVSRSLVALNHNRTS